jgi:hypothetical protein
VPPKQPTKTKNRRAARLTQPKGRRAGQPWTVAELADELRVSDQYIYNMVRADKITVLDLDGVIRIPDPVARKLKGEEPAQAA